jgi:tripartite-type tricarboxylate transporter receptor subunit TctC
MTRLRTALRMPIRAKSRPRANRLRRIANTASIALAGLAFWSPLSPAEPFPDRPIHVVVANEPGGQSDALARAIASSFTRTLGQPLVIDYRPGAGGTIGAQGVAQARPDGCTLLIGGLNNVVLAPLLRSDLRYAPATDLLPLGGIVRVPYGIAVATRIPVKNLAELAAYARDHPGELTFASGGTGSTSQLAMELLRSRLALNLLHVPYRGIIAALPDLMSGRVDMLATDLAVLLPLARNGNIRIVAVGGAHRTALAPQIPTVAEQALPGYEVEPWYGLYAPAGVPEPISQKLSRALSDALDSEEIRQSLLAQGYELTALSAEALRALAAAETAKYAGVIDAAGMRQPQ